jgi:predicted DNA-binding WGR domain protein
MSARRFEFSEGTSNKFWIIERSGSTNTVTFGRIGTAGQVQTKDHGTEDEASKAYQKLIDEKLRKGYIEVTAGSVAQTPPASQPSAKEAKKKKDDAPKEARQKAPAEVKEEEPIQVATVTEQIKPPADASAVAPVIAAAAERTLGLSPSEFLWATWRPWEPLARPEIRPFDRNKALETVKKIIKAEITWQWNWEKAALPHSMSREEAYFWFHVLTDNPFVKNGKLCYYFTDQKETEKIRQGFLDRLAALDCTAPLSPDDAKEWIEREITRVTPEMAIPLFNLFPLDETLQIIGIERKSRHSHDISEARNAVVNGIRLYVLPYLSADQREWIRKLIVPQIDVTFKPRDLYSGWPYCTYLAAMMGAHDTIRQVVKGIQDDRYTHDNWGDHYQRPQVLIFGLGDPEEVKQEMKRLRLSLRKPEYISAWLAHTEYSALDAVADAIASTTNRDEARALMEVFTKVRAPEAAPFMLELRYSSKAPQLAGKWLDENMNHTVPGLISALPSHSRRSEEIIETLRKAKSLGFEPLIDESLSRVSGDTAQRVRKQVLEHREEKLVPFDDSTTPEWLSKALPEAKAAKAAIPSWAQPAFLPPLRVDGHCLNEEQVKALLQVLQKTPCGERHPLTDGLKANGEAASRDAFAWYIFEQWMIDGAPSKEKWALFAIGHLGGDRSALKLTPLIRAWPGEAQHQRAVLGLQCLRAIATDTALMQLNGIAQKVPFKALKTRAMECMEEIAKERNMTRPELEDRIVPDCGLDERGSRVFDFGPRSFRFILSPELKAMIKEESGKARPDLPKPTSKDDEKKAGQALDEWKILKKQVAEVARIQATRLEQAMVTGRRWDPESFQLLLVRHPLMTHLVQRVLWAACDASGKAVKVFRVTEEQELADSGDESLSLSGFASVSVIHPLNCPDDEKRRFGELFSDYEILQPFPQLSREIYRLEGDEINQSEIKRFGGKKIPAVSVAGTLDRLGWVRGIPADAGYISEHSKPFYGAAVTAVVEYETGFCVGYLQDSEDMEIDRVVFIPGIAGPEMYREIKDAIPLKDIDPVVISEVLADLTLVASKALQTV